MHSVSRLVNSIIILDQKTHQKVEFSLSWSSPVLVVSSRLSPTHLSQSWNCPREAVHEPLVHGAMFPTCQFSGDNSHYLLVVPEILRSVYFLQRIRRSFNLFFPLTMIYLFKCLGFQEHKIIYLVFFKKKKNIYIHTHTHTHTHI